MSVRITKAFGGYKGSVEKESVVFAPLREKDRSERRSGRIIRTWGVGGVCE